MLKRVRANIEYSHPDAIAITQDGWVILPADSVFEGAEDFKPTAEQLKIWNAPPSPVTDPKATAVVTPAVDNIVPKELKPEPPKPEEPKPEKEARRR